MLLYKRSFAKCTAKYVKYIIMRKMEYNQGIKDETQLQA